MPSAHAQRLAQLRARLSENQAAAILVSHLPNVFYLCGFTGENAMLLASRRRATLFTDPRFALQARNECSGAGTAVEIVRGPLPPAVGDHIRRSRPPGAVLFEEERLSVAQAREIKRAAAVSWSWRGVRGMVEALREVKDRHEIDRMRAAAHLGSRVMRHALTCIRPGIAELDLAAEIEYQMKKWGASGPSFETIVASGPRAALPHARPTSKRLKKRELVVLDLGVILHGYCSDLTRTVHLGRASAEVRRWYGAVLAAQSAARQALRAGTEAGQVDEAARQVLRREGLERYFVHSTGHGLGIEVHERPSLGRNQTARLLAGSVVTIEPGVYFPGRGGIRIEDDVLVEEKGSETLTEVPRELLEI
jgi:Xaa-Pro aminopeptidase